MLLFGLLVISSCGGSNSSPDSVPDAVEEAAAPPTLQPGAIAGGQVDIEGTTIEYFVVTPEGFAIGDSAPVLLAFPPGGQDAALTETIVVSTYQDEAVARGWVVISPAAPKNTLFFRALRFWSPASSIG